MMDWRRLLSAQRLGHRGAEAVTPARSPFQKDWDRIVFCSAFRRLQDKTQVHSLPVSDYVRTRLTHSMEVSSVGRSLGAAVGQNVVSRGLAAPGISAAEFGHIVAAACLSHDIGNPPFGHFGEDTVRAWFADNDGGAALLEPLAPAERADFLGFEGNAQGFRILTRLQNWRDAGGLRLTAATLATFAKYPFGSLDTHKPGKFGYFAAEADLFAEVAETVGLEPAGSGGWHRHPLAYLVEAADDICYRVVDLEDGFKLNRIAFGEAEPLLLALVGAAPPRYREIPTDSRRIAYLRAKAIGALIDQCVEQFLRHETQIMRGLFTGDLLARTAARPVLDAVETLTRARIFESRERYEREVKGAAIITTLLDSCCTGFLARERGETIPDHAAATFATFPEPPTPGTNRYHWLLAVTDFVSGMTDTYAQSQYRRLLQPSPPR
jgi:dGTPase